MSDTLFDLPPESEPPLVAARRRFNAAQSAYDESDTDETGELTRELDRAREALIRLEAQEVRRFL